jgi:hypothetical protein
VGEKDRRVGVGEELLLHLAEAPKANRRNQDQRDHNQPAPLQGLPKSVAIKAEQQAGIGIVIAVRADLEEVVPKQRCHRDGEHPGKQQRDADNRKKREHELARGVGAEADPGESHDADHGRAEQRDLGFACRLFCGVTRVFPTPHRDLHAFGNDDAIVHQHAHGDDERAERNAFHFDGEQSHEQERADHGQQQRDPDNPCRAQAHEKSKHDDDNADRHGQIDEEVVGRLIHDDMLLVDGVKLDAVGDLNLQIGKSGIDAIADVNNVFRCQPGDTEGERLDTVKADHDGGIVLAAARHFGNVSQIDDIATDTNRQPSYVADAVRTFRRLDSGAYASPSSEPAGSIELAVAMALMIVVGAMF